MSNRKRIKKKEYKYLLRELQIELVKLQKHLIESEEKLCIIFEGRDAAGKDGTIKRFIEHLSPREVRVVALGKPSDRDLRSWYFQRYVPHLPAGGEMVFFNRSWYNRAGVEPVMGFCTPEESEEFLQSVGSFEKLLVDSKIRFVKYYLDISKAEQARRLAERRKDPLKQWKISPVDEKAQELWDDYSAARDRMFRRSSFAFAPWHVVHCDHKKTARIRVMQHLLSQMEYPGKRPELLEYDPTVVCRYEPACHGKGLIFP